MRNFLPRLAAVGTLATVIVAVPAAQAAPNPSLGKWYPHALGTCGNTTVKYSLTQKGGTGSDLDTCAEIGLAVAGVQSRDYPTKAPLTATIPAGATVAGTVWATTFGEPWTISADVTLNDETADKTLTPVGSQTTPAVLCLGSILGGYVPLPFKFTTTAPIPKGDLMDLTIGMHSLLSSAIGYSKPHVTSFTIS